jgi:hypothetical protein
MRGEQESKCLNIVKGYIFRDKCKKISDEEIKEDYYQYINDSINTRLFGLLEKDIIEIITLIKNVIPNNNLNNFPDFVAKNGFIEHFQITSSKTNKKGAVHKRKMSEFNSKVDKEIKQTEEEWNKNPSFDTIRSKDWNVSNPEHNYEYLVNSFKKNWENHIESYKNYHGSKEVGVFMVEYNEFALSMNEGVYNNWINGMTFGDYRHAEKFKTFRLSRDRNLLKYIKQFEHEIKYVIFVYLEKDGEKFEIIKLHSIPKLLDIIPWEYKISSLIVNTYRGIKNISVPVNEDNAKKSDISMEVEDNE